jgi:hypothetical protein
LRAVSSATNKKKVCKSEKVEWENDWLNDWLIEWMNEWMGRWNEWMDEWVGGMNEWMSEWINNVRMFHTSHFNESIFQVWYYFKEIGSLFRIGTPTWFNQLLIQSNKSKQNVSEKTNGFLFSLSSISLSLSLFYLFQTWYAIIRYSFPCFLWTNFYN